MVEICAQIKKQYHAIFSRIKQQQPVKITEIKITGRNPHFCMKIT